MDIPVAADSLVSACSGHMMTPRDKALAHHKTAVMAAMGNSWQARSQSLACNTDWSPSTA